MRGSEGRLRGLGRPGTWRDALIAVLVAASGATLTLIALALPGTPAWGFDFDAYYQAAVRLAETGSPYAPETLIGQFDLGPVAGLFVYSPVPAQLVAPLTALDQATATQVWFLGRASLLAATCLLIPAPMRVRLTVFALAVLSMPVLRDLVLGNVSSIVTFLTVVAWRFLDRPLAGIAVAGSLFLRPTMGLFLLWWLARVRWRPALAVIVGVALIGLVSVALIGVGPYLDYVRLLGNIGAVTGVENNLDLASVAAGLGASATLTQLLLAGSFALAIGASAVSLLRDREVSFVVTAIAVLFASPLLWDHYLTQLIVVAAFLAARGRWWGLVLLPLTWLPPMAMPLLAVAALISPFLVPDRGEPASRLFRRAQRS